MNPQELQQKTAAGDSSEANRYLSFSLGTEEYAIPLLSVKEAIAMPEIRPMPLTPPHFLGVMNLRGQVIPIIDLRTKLSIKPSGGAEMAVIICDLASLCLGVVVDSINSVLAPEAGEVSDRPEVQSQKVPNCITGVYKKENKLVLFLDIAQALDVADHAAVSKAAKAA